MSFYIIPSVHYINTYINIVLYIKIISFPSKFMDPEFYRCEMLRLRVFYTQEETERRNS